MFDVETFAPEDELSSVEIEFDLYPITELADGDKFVVTVNDKPNLACMLLDSVGNTLVVRFPIVVK